MVQTIVSDSTLLSPLPPPQIQPSKLTSALISSLPPPTISPSKLTSALLPPLPPHQNPSLRSALLPHVNFNKLALKRSSTSSSVSATKKNAISDFRIVVEVESRAPVLPVSGSPMFRHSHLERQSRQVLTPHPSNFDIEVLVGRGRHQGATKAEPSGFR